MTPHTPGDFRSRTLADMGAAVRRRSGVAVTCFLALSAGVVAAVLLSPPIYTGELKLLVKQDRADSVVSGAADAAPARDELSEPDLLSEVELIKADDLLEKVAKDAGLANRLIAADESRTDAEALARATASLRRDLVVTPIKRTWLIDVAYQSEDPQLARGVLETLVRLYLEKHLTLHRPAGTYQFFSEQTSLAKTELQTAQHRLARFNERHQVVSPAAEKEGVLQRLVEFDAMRAQASAQLAETNQRLSVLSSELPRVPAQHTSEIRTIDDAAALQDVKARILTLEMKRAELLQKFSPGYRLIVDIDRQLYALRGALAEARSTPVREETVAVNPTRQWLDTELARTRAEQAAARARVQALAVATGEYRAKAQTLNVRDLEQQDLVRRLKEAEERYLLYARKQEEARISDELDRTRIANVVVAQAPAIAAEPERRPSLAALPLLLGACLLLSLALAVVFDALAPPVRVSASNFVTPEWGAAPLPGAVTPQRTIRSIYRQPRPTT